MNVLCSPRRRQINLRIPLMVLLDVLLFMDVNLRETYLRMVQASLNILVKI